MQPIIAPEGMRCGWLRTDAHMYGGGCRSIKDPNHLNQQLSHSFSRGVVGNKNHPSYSYLEGLSDVTL